MITLIHAHPYPGRSRASRAMLDAVASLPGLEVRTLHNLYPDFDIDVAAEQAALLRADLIVWMHPVFWYSTPALLKHWFDKVLAFGWAYGDGGRALHGKSVLWVPTSGGDAHAYSAHGAHRQPFEAFTAPIEETARYCGMDWQAPFVVQGAHSIDDTELLERGAALRARIAPWCEFRSEARNKP